MSEDKIKVALLHAQLEPFHKMVIPALESVGCEVGMVKYHDVCFGGLRGFDVAFCLGSVGVVAWTSILPLSFLFRLKLRSFVRRGGGVVGHCAGSAAFGKRFILPQIGNIQFKGAGLLDVDVVFPYSLKTMWDLIAGFLNMEDLIATVEYLDPNVIGVTPGKQKHFYDTGCAFRRIGRNVNVLAKVVKAYKPGLEGNPYDVCGSYGKGRVVLTNGNPEMAMPFNMLSILSLLAGNPEPMLSLDSDTFALDTEVMLDLNERVVDLLFEPPVDWQPELDALKAQIEWAASVTGRPLHI